MANAIERNEMPRFRLVDDIIKEIPSVMGRTILILDQVEKQEEFQDEMIAHCIDVLKELQQKIANGILHPRGIIPSTLGGQWYASTEQDKQSIEGVLGKLIHHLEDIKDGTLHEIDDAASELNLVMDMIY